jgi:photosystem II stability/assembly factor-like uncharacterized protein
MKNFISFSSLCISMLCVLSIESNAQWIQTNGPYGGTILSLAVMDSTIFAGTQYCGAYYSSDYGNNWNQIDDIPNNTDVYSFAVHNQIVIAAEENIDSFESCIFISTDGGRNWHRSASNISGNIFFSDSILLTVKAQGGIYLSTDFGETWNSAANNGLKNQFPTAFTVAPRTNSAGCNYIYFGTDSGLFISTDNGANWVEADSGMGDKYIVTVAGVGMNVVASTIHDGVFFSTNGGVSWSATSTPVPFCDCFVFMDSSTIFAGASGLLRSTDKGNSWMSVNNGFPKLYQWIRAIAVAPQKTSSIPPLVFVGIYYQGVFRTFNNGENWESVSRGIRAHPIEFIRTLPNTSGGTNLFADCLNGSGGLFISTDSGTNWRNDTTPGLSQYEITTLLNSDSSIFATTYGAGIFRSKDYGKTWIPIDSGLYFYPTPFNQATIFGSLVASGKNLFASASGVFQSTDEGDSWFWNGKALVPYEGTGLYDCEINKMIALDTVLFAGVDRFGMIRSSDKGKTWSIVNNGMTSKYIMDFAMADTTIFAATGDAGIFRSTGHGADWTSMNNGLTSLNIQSLVICGKNIFAGTIGGGVFVSTVGGTVWAPVNTGLTPTDIFCLAASTTDLYCATRFGGVWCRPLSEITGVKTQGNDSPKQFSLRQNYPNPFNPITLIEYGLPMSSNVTLKIFDILGREVKTLIGERQNAGNHSVEFHAANLPSGVYFYRLEAGTYHDTKKMLLLK